MTNFRVGDKVRSTISIGLGCPTGTPGKVVFVGASDNPVVHWVPFDKKHHSDRGNGSWHYGKENLEHFYEKGDKVRLREWDTIADDLAGMVESMKSYLGCDAEVTSGTEDGWITLDIDGGEWVWNPVWLELIEEGKDKPRATVAEHRGLDLLIGTAKDGVVGGWDYLRKG